MATPGVTQAVTDTNGAAKAVISHNLQNIKWRISQLSVDDGAGGVLTVDADVNGQPCTSSVTGVTPLTAHGVPPVDIGGHDVMNVNVTNGPIQAHLIITYYYDELAA